MELRKDKTVAFTGYRSQKIKHFIEDKNLVNVITTEVYRTVQSLYEQGFNAFLTGGSDGFDLIAANAVLRLKQEKSDISLVVVAPFKGQEEQYSAVDKKSYNYICECADATVTLAEKQTDKEQYLRRNDYLLANSSVVVCYYDGQRSGTMYTYNRAKNEGHIIINICEMLSDYFNNNSVAKRSFQRYNQMDGYYYCKEGIMLVRLNDKPLIIAFEQIVEVENKLGVLHIVLNNGIQLRAPLFSDDCQVWFPGMAEPTVWQSIATCYAQIKNWLLPK